ncbi:cytochrome c [Novosphingobium sp. NBM11]|uniref:c-type cytochrome n=1 Tax=Novosphingobium sp. NBM11 TaxID=2596914 RepID=UPI0018926180|nr:c-type cytochrome [Novosphingobium sp. NBM11]
MGDFDRRNSHSLWLVLALSAFVSGCDSRQGTAEALAERQSGGNTQAAGTISGNATRGQQIAQEKCGACHGADGNGGPDPHVPKLAGQSLPYLYWEIRAFKEGTRKSDIMGPTATALAYDDIADIATYFSKQTRKPDEQKDERRVAEGQSLFYSRMPSCAMCHTSGSARGTPMRGMSRGGMMGGGMGEMMGPGTANVPNLEGQRAAYVVDQLNRFATGERRGTVMNRMAASLDDADRQAIAEFLSSTP